MSIDVRRYKRRGRDAMVKIKWGDFRRSTHRVSMFSFGPILAAGNSVLISCWYQYYPHEFIVKLLGFWDYQTREECAKVGLDHEVRDRRFRPAFSSTAPGDYSFNQVNLIGGAQTRQKEVSMERINSRYS